MKSFYSCALMSVLMWAMTVDGRGYYNQGNTKTVTLIKTVTKSTTFTATVTKSTTVTNCPMAAASQPPSPVPPPPASSSAPPPPATSSSAPPPAVTPSSPPSGGTICGGNNFGTCMDLSKPRCLKFTSQTCTAGTNTGSSCVNESYYYCSA